MAIERPSYENGWSCKEPEASGKIHNPRIRPSALAGGNSSWLKGQNSTVDVSETAA